MADLVQFYGTGRRKSSIARVFLRPGSGKFTVNKKECRRLLRHRPAARRRQAVARHRRHRRDLRRHHHRQGWRSHGPGRRGQARHRPRAHGLQPRAAQGPQGRRPRHPRLAWQGTQEVRPEGRSRSLPVLASGKEAFSKYSVVVACLFVSSSGPHSSEGCRTFRPSAHRNTLTPHALTGRVRSQISLTRDQSRHR